MADDQQEPADDPPEIERARTPEVRYTPVIRGEGVTEAERYLQRLCERSFLRLWSYPGVYRDQGLQQRREGKEVTDLLVVFGDDIVIFSDKHCAFADSGNLDLDWSRWFKKAVMKSAEQVWGAERWILDHPDRLYLDRACTIPFPINLPPRERARVHRIVVAHGVSDRCREFHGGTGSLMLTPMITGEAHYNLTAGHVLPFAVGDLDPSRGFVHVLDDQSLAAVLDTLDTVSDFVTYLRRKEELIRSQQLLAAAGEDDLLALYLKHANDNGHYFPVPEDATAIVVPEGEWQEFVRNPQRRAQIEANAISYVWDELIEHFGTHMLAGTSSARSHPDLRDVEPALRYMAAESRTRRRVLAAGLLGLVARTPSKERRYETRVVGSRDADGPFYVFLALEHKTGESEEEYRQTRAGLLESYVFVTHYLYPTAAAVVGIATEPGTDRRTRSEDVMAFEAVNSTPEILSEARRLHEEVGFFRTMKKTEFTTSEYPEPPASPPPIADTALPVGENPRNKPCPCGSGKKYKRCHGRNAR